MVMGYGRKRRPTLHPIPVERPFQVMGVDIMELPATNKENHYVTGLPGPLVFPASDQKAI